MHLVHCAYTILICVMFFYPTIPILMQYNILYIYSPQNKPPSPL